MVGTSAAAVVIADLRDAFRRVGAPIIHIVRLYREDGSNADACRRGPIEDGLKLLISGSPGAEIAEGLAPQGAALDTEPKEMAIYKPRWGAFYNTPWRSLCDGLVSRRSPSAVAIFLTARAPPSTKQASETFESWSQRTQSQASTTVAARSCVLSHWRFPFMRSSVESTGSPPSPALTSSSSATCAMCQSSSWPTRGRSSVNGRNTTQPGLKTNVGRCEGEK